MVNFEIRNVVEGDFLQIAQIARKCSPMATERNSIYHIFTKHFKNTSFVVINESDRKIIGFLLGFISQDLPSECYIHLLCINPEFRGEGLAKNLFAEFCDGVKIRGCKKISLITKPQNEIAIKFYIKLGFISYSSDKTVKIGNVNVYKDYNGPDQDKIVFYKLI